ncbi:MAG: restriction endonuclease subunit S, partial [Dokdonella sp.]
LRFPEFRDDRGWITQNLGDVSVFSSGGTPSKAEPDYWNGDIPWISASSMYETSIADSDLKVTSLAIGRGTRLAPKGSLLILVRGSMLFNRVPMGIAAVDLAFNQDVKALEVASDVHAEFLLDQLIAASPRIPINETGIGAGKIETDTLENLPIFLPSHTEQQKIADCLMSLDEVIAAQGRKVEALKAHKRGLMQQLFPREGETRPRLRFPEFRDAPEWTLGKASDIVNVLQGYGFPERLQGSREGEFPFYKVSDISACVDAGGILLDEANNHIDADVLEELRAKLMPVGSTVFAKIGEAIRSNKRAITSRPCLVDNNAAGIKAIAGVAHDRFVYYLWCQIPLIEYAGGVVPAVNKSAMEQIPVCYPEPDEQQRIADCLSSLDAQITAEANQLAALKTHKQGLMQQLFPAPEAA